MSTATVPPSHGDSRLEGQTPRLPGVELEIACTSSSFRGQLMYPIHDPRSLPVEGNMGSNVVLPYQDRGYWHPGRNGRRPLPLQLHPARQRCWTLTLARNKDLPVDLRRVLRATESSISNKVSMFSTARRLVTGLRPPSYSEVSSPL